MRLEPNVEEGFVVNDEPDKVEGKVESRLLESVDGRVRVADERNEVEGSIVMEESENVLDEVEMVLKSVGSGVTNEETSVKVGASDVGSPELGVSVSGVPVLDGNVAVVGPPVNVGSGLESKEGRKKGVDVGESAGVPDRNVGSSSPSLVENGGSTPVKLKGMKAESDPLSSSSLMEGVDKPQ